MLQRIKEMYDTYRKSGMPPAYHKLGEYVKLSQGEVMGLLEATNPKNGAYNFSNGQYSGRGKLWRIHGITLTSTPSNSKRQN